MEVKADTDPAAAAEIDTELGRSTQNLDVHAGNTDPIAAAEIDIGLAHGALRQLRLRNRFTQTSVDVKADKADRHTQSLLQQYRQTQGG